MLWASALLAVATWSPEPPHVVVSPQSPNLSAALTPPLLRRRRLNVPTPSSSSPLLISYNTESFLDDDRSCVSVGQLVAIGGAWSTSPLCATLETTDCRYNCTAEDVITADDLTWLQSSLLPAVSKWFSAALQLRVPSRDPSLRFRRDAHCGVGGFVRMSQHILEKGIDNAHLLVLVTARPAVAAAYSAHCQEDEGFPRPGFDGASYAPRRPILGHINIRPQLLAGLASASVGGFDAGGSDAGGSDAGGSDAGGSDAGDAPSPQSSSEVDALLRVVLRETLYVLGFSASKIAQFPCPSNPHFNRHTPSTEGGATASAVPPPPPKPCAAVNSREPLENVRRRSNSVLYNYTAVGTPAALYAARRHYGCVETAAQA